MSSGTLYHLRFGPGGISRFFAVVVTVTVPSMRCIDSLVNPNLASWFILLLVTGDGDDEIEVRLPGIVEFVVAVVLDLPRSRIAGALGVSAPDANVDGSECGVTEVVMMREFVEQDGHTFSVSDLKYRLRSFVLTLMRYSMAMQALMLAVCSQSSLLS